MWRRWAARGAGTPTAVGGRHGTEAGSVTLGGPPGGRGAAAGARRGQLRGAGVRSSSGRLGSSQASVHHIIWIAAGSVSRNLIGWRRGDQSSSVADSSAASVSAYAANESCRCGVLFTR